MKKNSRTILIVCGVIAALVVVCVLLSMRGIETFHDKYEGSDLTKDVEGMERTGTYTNYLLDHEGADKPAESIEVDLYSNQSEGDVHEETALEGGVEKALYTGADSKVTWKVNVPKSGLYNICVDYFLPESRGVVAERSVSINGEEPFEDAKNITFTRIWTDGGEVRVDNQGNEIRPTQVEVFDWQKAYFRDDMGFVTEPYQFYFEQGENELTLDAVNEPMIISSLQIKAIEKQKTYAEYSAEFAGKGGSDVA